MFKQTALLAVSAASTYTILVRSQGPVLAESPVASRPSGSVEIQRLTAQRLNERPGVLAWGSNKNQTLSRSKDLPIVRLPSRLDYFNGRLLRDLVLADDMAIAVLDNGDVVQWAGSQDSDVDSPQLVLKGKNINKVQVSRGKSVYALANSGSIYSWPVSAATSTSASSSISSDLEKADTASSSSSSSNNSSNGTRHWCSYFSIFWGGNSSHKSGTTVTTLNTPSLSFGEYVKDIAVGNDHILALSSSGRVFSGSTGQIAPSESKGQYGIASMSQFDKAPEPGTLHEIKLLKKFPIAKIAVGDYHSLVLTKEGKLLGFGDNLYGQLGISYSYRTANIAVPTELPISGILFGGDIHRKVTNIAAGGSITYFTVNAGVESEDVYSMGNGLSGQLGTGSFAHSQRSPLKIKHFSGLSAFSEKLNKTVPINISSWSVGTSHTAVTLNSSPSSQDVLVWGSNESSQLGNGKRNIAGYPRPVPLYETDASGNSTLSPVGLQLLTGQTMTFTDHNGKTRKAKVDQVITCGDSATAVYYRRSK
ncbi:Fmp25p [Sugiyamaella lignohabitans]|uniref:Fmp25p n=1 Tax=Sugiyamaella lignohabitans TaxID=796027 RepID=A0A167E552_9ASCO|nr:Fmp25p [Sugiyamaella lignohabitans]ANB13651.1 Fmp25p [Sugiyamaella lignohabitans]